MLNVFMKKITFMISPSELFHILSNAETLSRATGFQLKGNAVPGEEFGDVAGKYCGKTLHAEQDRLIVQTWRDSKWKKGQEDSVLIFRLRPSTKGTELFVTQTGLPDGSIPKVKAFWSERFWKPIKNFIKAEKRAATPPKPRGRPRKNPLDGEAVAKVAKPRGRPSKTATTSAGPKQRGRAPNVKKVSAGPTASKRAEKTVTKVASQAAAKRKGTTEKTEASTTLKRRGRPTSSTVVSEKATDKSGTLSKKTNKGTATVKAPKRGEKKAK